MPRIDFNQQELAAGGVPDLSLARPNQAMAQLGQQASAVDQTLERIQQRDAAMEGAQALADFRLGREKRQQDLRTAAKTPDGFVDVALQDFDEHAQQLIDAHNSDRTKMFLEERLLEARDGEGREAIAWQANAMKARSEQLAVDTVNKYANVVNTAPGKFESALSDVYAMIDASGLDLVDADKMRSAAKSALSRSAVYGQIETNPAGVLKQLQSGKWDAYLDNDAKIAAVNGAQTEIKRRDSEARANAAMARQEAMFDIEQWSKDNEASLEETGKPVPSPYTDEQLKGILKPKQYEHGKHMHTRAAALFEATGDMRAQTPAEMAATVDRLRPVPGQQGYVDQQSIFEAAGKIMKSTLNARNGDPATAARSAFPNVALAWKQAEANPTDANTLRVALKRSLAAQAAMGVSAQDQKALPAPLANYFVGLISGAKPEEAAKTLKSIEAQFGPTYWGPVMKQLAPKLDGHARIAPVIKDPVQAALLISGARSADPKAGGIDAMRQAAGVDKTGVNSISALVSDDDRVKRLVTSISQRIDPANYAGQIPKSIELLALQRMKVYGEDKPDATEAAIKHIVEENYDTGWAGRPFRIPKGAGDVDHIEFAARQWQAKIRSDVVDLPTDNASTPGASTAADYVSSIVRKGYWVTNDNETGVILYSERGVPVTVRGRPVEHTWADLMAAKRPKPNTDFYGNRLVR